MIYWTCAVAIFHAIFPVEGNSDKPMFSLNSSKCRYATGLTVGNRSTEFECCQTVIHNYYSKVLSHDRYLSTFLESLQTWNCPQLKQECKRRTFNYNDFTSLMYMRFCNRSEMEEQCYDDIRTIVMKQNTRFQTTTSTFDELVSTLDLISLNNQDLINPCVQVAMYDIDSGGHGHFYEIIEPIVPFCSLVWCGFNENVFVNQKVSTWTCLPSRCRLYVILYFVVKIILAVAIVICNTTILGELRLNKEQDVQTIYRLSLAIADFIMGIIVIPINTGTMYKILFQSSSFTESQNITGFTITNDSSLPMRSVSVQVKQLEDLMPDKFPTEYVNAIGFFTVLSSSMPIYTIVAASFDRFVAISRPLRYNDFKAIFAAKIAVASIWCIGIAFAALPIAVPDLGYAFVGFNLTLLGAKPIVILFSFFFFLPVLLMWSSIIATYVSARPSLRKHDKQLQTDHSMRLLGTLGVMLAVFTVCVLPFSVMVIVNALLSFANITDPKNFDPAATTKLVSVELSLNCLFASNSLWNCFIYSTRENDFRSAVKLLYKRIAKRLKLESCFMACC